MAAETMTRAIRRGLPRVRGGAPWPPAADVEVMARGTATDAPAAQHAPAAPAAPVAPPTTGTLPASVALPAAGTLHAAGTDAVASVDTAAAPAATSAMTSAPAPPSAPASQATPAPGRVRRGLPRIAGGAPWPDVEVDVLPAAASAPTAMTMAATTAQMPAASDAATTPPVTEAPTAPTAPPVVAPAVAAPARIRRGLPRVAGGPAWPEVKPRPLAADAAPPAAAPPAAEPTPGAAAPPKATPVQALAAEVAPADATPAKAAPAQAAPIQAAPAKATPIQATTTQTTTTQTRPASTTAAAAPALPATPARPAARTAPAQTSVPSSPATEPRRYRGLTASQWVWRSIGGAAAIVAFALLVMLAARGLLTFAWASDFVRRFPGAYRLPAAAPVGQPLWLEWQHFLNAFFMLLIIRTGIQIRGERKPPASWSPRWNSTRRISLTVWLHQSLDLLWLVNGIAFVVALFATGQWMRVVPTSWSVFPNALSAALKYASMNWPTEDGWANYNSLQQLSYFAVIFLLAPLAIITGIRMSGLWQKKWERASRAYPIQLARAIHFPTMIAFCVFIVIHITLVLATGALRNLNHMYGHSDTVSWTGFWFFVGALLVMAGGWVAARPLVIAPIASLFGKVGR